MALAATVANAVDLGKESVDVEQCYSYVREKTNSNDHPDIDTFLAYCGLDPGYAWCQAFYLYSVNEAFSMYGKKQPFGRSASVAQTAKRALNRPLELRVFDAKDVAWGKVKLHKGDLLAFQSDYGGSAWTHGHAAMVISSTGKVVCTIEGNTKPGPGGDQTGKKKGDLSAGKDGVYERDRALYFAGRFQPKYFIRPISWEAK